MSVPVGIGLFPLQAIDAFRFDVDRQQAMVFLIGVGVVVAAFVLVTVLKNRGNISAFNDGRSTGRRRRGLSAFALHRLAHDMGLDREQTKMLEFVLRCDNVVDPAKSLDSPELMDRHFKRAYALIEQTSISEDEMNAKMSILFSIRNVIETYADTVSITSTRQIPEHSAATLVLNDVGYPTRVLSAQGESLIVEHPVDNRGAPVGLSKGGRVTLTFFVKANKGFSAIGRVVGFMETMNRRIVKLTHSDKVKKLSNRRFRRRRTTISTAFYLVRVETSARRKDNRLVVDKRQFSGNIMDISVGGCSIRTTVPINAGHKIKIEFTQDDATVAALGEVLRTNRTGHNTVMHIKFLKIPRKSLNFINAMVYEYAYS